MKYFIVSIENGIIEKKNEKPLSYKECINKIKSINTEFKNCAIKPAYSELKFNSIDEMKEYARINKFNIYAENKNNNKFKANKNGNEFIFIIETGVKNPIVYRHAPFTNMSSII